MNTKNQIDQLNNIFKKIESLKPIDVSVSIGDIPFLIVLDDYGFYYSNMVCLQHLPYEEEQKEKMTMLLEKNREGMQIDMIMTEDGKKMIMTSWKSRQKKDIRFKKVLFKSVLDKLFNKMNVYVIEVEMGWVLLNTTEKGAILGNLRASDNKEHILEMFAKENSIDIEQLNKIEFTYHLKEKLNQNFQDNEIIKENSKIKI